MSVVVDNPYGATWRVKWSRAAEGVKTRSWGDAWDIHPASPAGVFFEAAILASPPGHDFFNNANVYKRSPRGVGKIHRNVYRGKSSATAFHYDDLAAGGASELTLLALLAVAISIAALALSIRRR